MVRELGPSRSTVYALPCLLVCHSPAHATFASTFWVERLEGCIAARVQHSDAQPPGELQHALTDLAPVLDFSFPAGSISLALRDGQDGILPHGER